MKTIFISSVVLLFSFYASAQNNDNNITIGKKETIHSRSLNENRAIWIYTPGITSQNTDANKQYPVLYLLDGNAHFFSTVGIIQQLSQANGNGVLPEMIVVAIENTNRMRDFVPPAEPGKVNTFVDFLSAELIPYIDKNYNTAPYKLLVGHSLGGLIAMDILTKSPGLFNAYIAIDPSMWYSNEKFLNNIITSLPKQNMNGRRLFIGTANTMPKGITVSELTKNTSPETQHIRSIFKLDSFLKNNTNGLHYTQKYYEAERHTTIPLISEYDGLRFIFDYYHLDATEKDFADPTAAIATQLKTHYANVSEKMGYKNAAPETLINYLAYEALGKKQNEKAKALFELNIESYPKSSNVYDSYADYFLAQKDTANAITNYKKILQLNNNTETQRKLDVLIKKEITIPATVNLQMYTGVYVLETYNIPITIETRGATLWAKAPEQPDDELQWLSENVFTVKGQQGYRVTFHMNGNTPTGFTSVQPNGTFKAIFKNMQAK